MGLTIKKVPSSAPVDKPVAPPMKAIDLRKRLTRPDGTRMRRRRDADVITKIHTLQEKGLIKEDQTGRMGDPDTLDQFIRLYNIGAPEDVVIKLLNINKQKYKLLLGQYQALCIENITSLGPLGVLGSAYTRLHDLSQKAMASLSSLEDAKTRDDRKEVLELMRFVKDVESSKVGMLVSTGAVAQRKKVEVHQYFESSAKVAKVVQPSTAIAMLGALLQSNPDILDDEDMDAIEGELGDQNE